MSKNSIKRIGVLTGGGDCPGLNAVIRAIVKSAILQYGYEVFGVYNSYEGLLLPEQIRAMSLNSVRGILPKGGTILGTSNRTNPFGVKMMVGDRVITEDHSEQVIETYHKYKLDALITIGGDGTLIVANKFAERGLSIVGVPKTIDNDLSATDYTFGFSTALETATEAIDKLHTTAESHHRVLVLELMGRDAGWIALYAGLAGGADVILIPEIPYNIESVCKCIKTRKKMGRNFSIVVVAEGVTENEGEQVYYNPDRSPVENLRLGGIGQVIARQIAEKVDMETRVIVLGHLQRGGSPDANDRVLSSRYGVAAVELVSKQQFGRMVSLRGTEIQSVTLKEATQQLKKVPVDSDVVRTARSIGISFGD